MKKWVNGQATLYNDYGVKVGVLSQGMVVDKFDDATFNQVPRAMVKYQNAVGSVVYGWVYEGFLEDYIEGYPRDCVQIDSQTPNPMDAEQYLTLFGVQQVNMCGELCAAFLLQVPFADFIAKWQRSSPTVVQRIFNLAGSRRAGGTSDADLRFMLNAMNAYEKASVPLTQALRDPILNRSRYTVAGLQSLQGRAICSVHIDSVTGRLRGGGVLHWVVITKVNPERAGYGTVELYNPFPNRIEIYSWKEFLTSAGEPYGVVING